MRKPYISLVYYSNQTSWTPLHTYCQMRLRERILDMNIEFISVTSIPVHFIEDESSILIIYPQEEQSAHIDIYQRILKGLDVATAEYVALIEHDVLYPVGIFIDSYFSPMLSALKANPGKLVYNSNIYHLTDKGFFKAIDWCNFMSNLAGPTDVMKQAIQKKLEEATNSIDKCPMWAEPGEELGVDFIRESVSACPVVDIRHGQNLTGDRAPADGCYLEEIPDWGITKKLLERMMLE